MIKDSTKQLLGDDFISEEVRCGFRVPSKMKKVWAVELDLFLEFKRICEKYGLRYFMIWGSLLGTVRHHGFIPWDDDMDVAMWRKDIEKFAEVAPKELKYPYFFQTPYTDPGSYFSLPRLRNSSTTGMIKTFSHDHFNQGIWLDIEIIDYCDPSSIQLNRKNIYESVMKCATYMRKGSKYLDERRKKELLDYKTDNPLADFERIQKLASSNGTSNSDYVNIATITSYPPERQMWKASDFESVENMKFEGIDVPVPCGYDDILKTTYGDYMKFPPIEQRGEWHPANVFDPEKPYTEYIED